KTSRASRGSGSSGRNGSNSGPSIAATKSASPRPAGCCVSPSDVGRAQIETTEKVIRRYIRRRPIVEVEGRDFGLENGQLRHVGQVGAQVSLEEARAGAQLCALSGRGSGDVRGPRGVVATRGRLLLRALHGRRVAPRERSRAGRRRAGHDRRLFPCESASARRSFQSPARG